MLFPLALPPGMVTNGTLLQRAGRWVSGTLVRFLDAAVCPIGGWSILTADDSDPTLTLVDTFTGTNGTALTAHTPTGGTAEQNAFTWELGPSVLGGAGLEIQSNKITSTTDGASVCVVASESIPSPNYTVALTVTAGVGVSSIALLGVSARHDGVSPQGAYAYINAGFLYLYTKNYLGDLVQLDATAIPSFAEGTPYLLELTCNNSTLTASIDGTELCSLTDSSVTGTHVGLVGLPYTTASFGVGAYTGDGFGVTTLGGSASVSGVPRSILGWRGNDGAQTIGIGTNTNLYAHWLGNLYDLTPSGFTPGNAYAAYGSGGYGEGLYGVGPYGVSDPAQTTYQPPDVWHLDTFGDYLVGVMSPSDGNLYYWDRQPTTIAVLMDASAPTGCTGVVVTPERFVVALGAVGEVRKVAWASQSSLTDWTPSGTNTARDFTLEGKGAIVAGRRGKGETLIWTTDDLHAMRYIGGTLVYSFDRLGGGCGLIGPQAIGDFDSNKVWMGPHGFFVYDGYIRSLDCPVSDTVFADFNPSAAHAVVAVPNAQYGEICWYYASAGSVENDRYVMWNHRKNWWAIGALQRTAGCDSGATQYPVLADAQGILYEHEKAWSHLDIDGTTPLVPAITSGPIQLGDGDRVLYVSQLIPDEKNPVGSTGENLGNVELSLTTSFLPGEAETTHGPFPIYARTDARFSGRWVRLTATEVESGDWRLGTIRLDGSPAGRR